MVTKPIEYYNGIRMKADTGLHAQIARLVGQHLSPPALVLDFGCGSGALSQRLADAGYDLLSVDVDTESFVANTPFEQLDFNDAAAVSEFISRNADRFDLIIGVEVIEHVENPWQYVRDLRRLARPGGYVLISTPNVTSWYSRISFLRTGRLHQFGDNDREYGHINPVAEDELRLIAERSGLLTVALLPGGWLPRLWIARNIRGLFWNLMGFIGTFRMGGTWDGWCLIGFFQRPSGD